MLFPDNMSVVGISVVGKQIYFNSLDKQHVCLHFNFVSKAFVITRHLCYYQWLFQFGCYASLWGVICHYLG